MRRFLSMVLFGLWWTFACAGIATAAGGTDDEVIFRAMTDELHRNMDSLVMENLERPYFLSYTIDDAQDLTVRGVLGALVQSKLERSRFVTVELRVGNDTLDNSNFVGGFDRRGPGYAPITIENDYDALRNRMYLVTDDVYKDALRLLSKKRAYLQTTTVKDRPKDFLSQPASTFIGRAEPFDLNEPSFDSLVQAASAVFRDFPQILSSEVELTAGVVNQYMVGSTGTKARRGDRTYVLRVMMSGKSDGGEAVVDGDRFIVRSRDDFPGREEIAQWARGNAERIVKLLSAETVEEYAGPVILSGAAAGEFFRQLFLRSISGAPAPLSDNEQMAAMFTEPELANKVWRRVLPQFFDVYDDPTIDRVGGLKLVGGFAVDDAGGVPKKIELVQQGRLVNLPIGVAPTRKVSEPNGHARGAVSKEVLARPGNVIFESRDNVPETQLRQTMLKLCRDFDLEYGLVVRQLEDPDAARGGSVFRGRPRGRDEGLSVPLEVYKVYPDGREEPLRNLEFSNVTVRTLRDIVQTGRQQYVYNYLIANDYEMPVSIVCPSVLIEEMELKKSEEKIKRPPLLPSPLARK